MELALERRDQVGQPLGCCRLPGVELGMLGGAVLMWGQNVGRTRRMAYERGPTIGYAGESGPIERPFGPALTRIFDAHRQMIELRAAQKLNAGLLESNGSVLVGADDISFDADH
jgi:hypothetical protein